jgi:hypothetical protein
VNWLTRRRGLARSRGEGCAGLRNGRVLGRLLSGLGLFPVLVDVHVRGVAQSQAAKLYCRAVHGMVAGHDDCFLLLLQLSLEACTSVSAGSSCLECTRRIPSDARAAKRRLSRRAQGCRYSTANVL